MKLILAAMAMLTCAFTGCYLPPPGDPPVRYSADLPGKSVSVTSNVVFSTAQDGTANDLTLDVYRPTPDTVTKRPLVVFVHGGAYRVGGKTSSNMVVLARAFAQKGYVTASINYRLLGPPEGNCGHAGVDPATCATAALAAAARRAGRRPVPAKQRGHIRNRPRSHRYQWCLGRGRHRAAGGRER